MLTLTTFGAGKRTPIDDYPSHHRGGSGVITFKINDNTGPVVAARMVKDSQELIVISKDGIVLRTRMDGISIQGRSTQGVAVIGVGPGDSVGSVATIEMSPDQGAATADGPEPDMLPGMEDDTTNGESAPAKKTPRKSGKAALSKADAAMKKAEATLKKTKTNGRKPGSSSKPSKS